MKKGYIWGTGDRGISILKILKNRDSLIGFIDNDPSKAKATVCGYPVIPLSEARKTCDFIILSMRSINSALYQLKENDGFENCRVIVFYDLKELNDDRLFGILNEDKWRIAALEDKVNALEMKLDTFITNAGYEIADGIRRNKYSFPILGENKEAIRKMAEDRCSFVRYGDGEFEIIFGNERAPFQKYSKGLAERLLQVFSARNDRLLIGIASNYGYLDEFQDITIKGIREYMNHETRKRHMAIMDPKFTYYDAYLFKCYFPYRNKLGTAERVENVKSIWKGREVLLIEGEETRAGVGNDLFANVKSLRRILCPTKDSYDYYDEILDCVKKQADLIGKGCLILTILGPVSELLVYDMMMEQYQAIDIGQIDMDYEWFIRGVEDRVPIYGKYVSQLSQTIIPPIMDEAYLSQIVAKVE